LSLVDFLGKQLEDYVAALPIPVHVIRMGQRSGLIRARLRGLLHCYIVFCHLYTAPTQSLKVLEFFFAKIKSLKVPEYSTGLWNSSNSID